MSWSPPLGSQQPARRRRSVFGRKKARNTYRRRPARIPPKKKFWTRLLLWNLGFAGLAVLCLALVLLYYHLLTAPYFCIKDIRDIEIYGTKRLSADLICRLAGVGPGTNLLALRPQQVEQTLAAHPWIARAELTRKWPSRLEITVYEREPVALVQLDELYYTDRQGSLFKPLSPGEPHDFPVITGLRQEQLINGVRVPPRLFKEILALLNLLKTAQPPLNLANISEIHVDQERGFTLIANGLRGAVHLGARDLPGKLAKFASVWPFLKQQGLPSRLEGINLDYPRKVLLSLKEPVVPPAGKSR